MDPILGAVACTVGAAALVRYLDAVWAKAGMEQERRRKLNEVTGRTRT